MSSVPGNFDGRHAPHTHGRSRYVRHSYEEVDLPGKDDDPMAEDGGQLPNSHSYEDVDFIEMEVGRVAAPLESDKGDAKGQGPVRINLSHTIRRLRMCGWYWGDISSERAKEILKRSQNGSFILRDSSDACHLFTLSLKANNIIVSVRVAFSRGLFKLDSWNQEDSPSFHSVVDMIEYYLEDESHEFFVELPNIGEFPVCLKYPIWKEVPDLQHMCRTTIVKFCRTSEKLSHLPLPPHLIRYVLEFSPEDSVSTDTSPNSDHAADCDSITDSDGGGALADDL
jgi:suppressor of cytokine signaling 7